MPTYTYIHTAERGPACEESFTIVQSMRDDALTACPTCRHAVARQVGLPGIAAPQGNAHLRNLGFSKLVRRDKGVYENVSAQAGEPTIVTQDNMGKAAAKTIAD